MKKYCVTVTQIVDAQFMDWDDVHQSPCGVHFFYAFNKRHALDLFHWSVPVSCLENFRIEVERVA